MVKVIVCAAQKGGTLKTSVVLNLSVLCASKGLRTLVVDLDPQASLTDYMGLYNAAMQSNRNVVELLYDGKSVADCVHETKFDNLYCISSVLELVDQNELLLPKQALRFALQDASSDYDVVFIDTAPAAKKTTMSAYIAASGLGSVIIPARLDSTVMRGIVSAVTAIESVSTKLRLPVPEYKILKTCVPGHMTTAERTGEAVLDKFFYGKQFDTSIHFTAKAIEASYKWEPIVTYMPKNRASEDYMSLAKELELWGR